MKPKFLTALLLASAASALQAQDIKFTETEHDFGTIQEKNGNVSHQFHFKNTGNKPLLIKSVVTSCGCTSAEWSKKAYQPGEEGTIKLTYHPEGRTQKEFYSIAQLYTNKPKNGVVEISIQGKVNLSPETPINHFQPSKGQKASYKAYQASDDYEIILERVRKQLYPSNTGQADRRTARLLSMMTPEGIWKDIDYACFFRTNWEPVDHLKRLETIAASYTNPESAYFGNPVVYEAIKAGLEAWDKKDPKCHNWWYNQIAAPQSLANIFALMEAGTQKVPATTATNLMKRMAKSSDPRKWTGANKMDIAIHHLIRGCVEKNDSIVRINSQELFYPVRIVKGEGIQEDMSYQQHGTQLYIGGYGTVFMENIGRMGSILAGTRYGMTDEQLQLFSNFARNTYLNVFRGPYMDFSVMGRSVSRTNMCDFSGSVGLFRQLAQLDPAHKGEYEAAIKRFKKGGDPTYQRDNRNQMFYCSDYMLQNRKKYDFSVRTASTRTTKTESGNGENLYCTYMSDGATVIRVNGDEYYNIFPVWEWDKIPGTTSPAGETKDTKDWGASGTSTFTGGVSDGMYGAMAFDMKDYGLTARKAWFMFDDAIVCLGAGISSKLDKEIQTTVNQCHLKGQVEQEPQWIWHDRIAYYFPEQADIRLKTDKQKGSWAKINFNYSTQELQMPVFNLTINHGKQPSGARYAYILFPGVDTPEEMKQCDTQDLAILSNTDQIQAVSSKKTDMWQVVFYAPGTLRHGDITVEAKKPCIALIKGASTSNPDIRVEDPAHKAKLVAGTDLIVSKK